MRRKCIHSSYWYGIASWENSKHFYVRLMTSVKFAWLLLLFLFLFQNFLTTLILQNIYFILRNTTSCQNKSHFKGIVPISFFCSTFNITELLQYIPGTHCIERVLLFCSMRQIQKTYRSVNNNLRCYHSVC